MDRISSSNVNVQPPKTRQASTKSRPWSRRFDARLLADQLNFTSDCSYIAQLLQVGMGSTCAHAAAGTETQRDTKVDLVGVYVP